MPSTSIQLHFADGEYTFALKLPQLIELEEKCGFVDAKGNKRKKPVLEIYAGLLQGRFVDESGTEFGAPHRGAASITDIRETLRLGLIGGGEGLVNGTVIKVSPLLAKSLVERYVDDRPVNESWPVASSVIAASVEGYDPPKKAEPPVEAAAGMKKRRSTTRKSSATRRSRAPTGAS